MISFDEIQFNFKESLKYPNETNESKANRIKLSYISAKMDSLISVFKI